MQTLIAELQTLTWDDVYNAVCVLVVCVMVTYVLGMTIVVIGAWIWPHEQVRSAVRATFGATAERSA